MTWRVSVTGIHRSFISPCVCRHVRSRNTKSTLPNGAGAYSTSSDSRSLQPLDLLERYRSLVTLGKIKSDDEQIRVVMQLRRLQKDLDGYAPPALPSQHLEFSGTSEAEDENSRPWWIANSDRNEEMRPEHQALIRVRTHAEEIADLTTPKGLLLTGPPGSGKSFLLDLWFSALPTPFKARKHYSELVLEIYRAVWEETRHRMTAVQLAAAPAAETSSVSWNKSLRDKWRELLRSGALPTRWTRRPSSSIFLEKDIQPPIAFVIAQRLVLRHWLLLFDEIQLLDVSSATLLADVLSWFWRMGGVVVGSSNKVPDDLYKNGVQRERLEPFVEALKARCPVIIMRSEQDWREVRAAAGKSSSWFVYGQEKEFERKLKAFSDKEQVSGPRDVAVFGRSLHIPWSTDTACKFSFAQLCDESLGPADYLTLASTFPTIAITSIPILKLSAKNQARRFISLIDALYECRCRVVCLAETQPAELFFPDDSSTTANSKVERSHDIDVMMAEAVAETQDVYRPNVSAYDAPNMAEAPKAPASSLALDTLSIFSGKDEQFAFKRALSRLLEMTSEKYAEEERWTPLPLSSRKWEGMAYPPGHTPYRRPWQWTPYRGSAEQETADFASEAANEGSARSEERPEAPRLSEAHVWGVREDWGEFAKDWGRGAKVYENQTSASKRTRSQEQD